MREIYVTKTFMPPFEEYVSEIRPLWDTAWVTNNGCLHQQFEQKAAEYLKVKNICMFANGHLALCIAIRVLRLTGEVITTPFTFASTTHAIVENGLTPVFCDIEPGSYTMDVSKIEPLITEKTSAILPVHVYGHVCDDREIERIARKYHLKVIYDAAHAFGEQVNGAGVGTLGDISMFSFHATKVFHTVEGGALTFGDGGLRGPMCNKKNFGITSPEHVVDVGMNAKMNELQAAMGLVNLRHIDGQIACRKRVTERYRERLGGIPGVVLPQEQPFVRPNYSYFPVVFDETAFGKARDEVFDALQQHHIHPRKYFYPITSAYECYRGRFDAESTPVAKRISERVLTLPLYAELTDGDVDTICDVILGAR